MCNIYRSVKTLDTLNQNLLIAKLATYGFDTKNLYYIKSYLGNRKQKFVWIVILVLGKKLWLGYRKVPF